MHYARTLPPPIVYPLKIQEKMNLRQTGEPMQLQHTDQDPSAQILVVAYRRGLAIRQNSQPATGESATPLNTNAPTQGRLCKDGAKANSRNCTSSKDRT